MVSDGRRRGWNRPRMAPPLETAPAATTWQRLSRSRGGAVLAELARAESWFQRFPMLLSFRDRAPRDFTSKDTNELRIFQTEPEARVYRVAE